MSKPTIAELLSRCAALEDRVHALEAAPRGAAPRRATLPSQAVPNFAARCASYCKEHGVATVPQSVVAGWRAAN